MKTILLSQNADSKNVAIIHDSGIVSFKNLVWHPKAGWYPEKQFSIPMDSITMVANEYNKAVELDRAKRCSCWRPIKGPNGFYCENCGQYEPPRNSL